MNKSLALTQKVNFYVSVAFILAFGGFLTTTVVSAINRDSSDIQYLTLSGKLDQ